MPNQLARRPHSPVFQVDHLSLAYPRVAASCGRHLKGISFAVERGASLVWWVRQDREVGRFFAA